MKVELTPTIYAQKYRYNSVNNLLSNSYINTQSLSTDSVNISNNSSLETPYKLFKKDNQIRLVSFKSLQDPTVPQRPSIRVGLQNSKLYKGNILETRYKERGEEFKFEVTDKTLVDPDAVLISTQDNKPLGNMPKSLVRALGSFLVEEPENFSLKLYGTTSANAKNPENVLVDIEYNGDKKPQVQARFNTLLYKNAVTPEEVLHRILDYKKVLHGDKTGIQEAWQTEKTLKTITDELKNNRNQKILLIGHNKPDGDTIGSCIGLKSALDYMGKKQVDIAIDDTFAGFLRNSVGAEDIKKSPGFMDKLNQGIDEKIADLEEQKEIIANAAETSPQMLNAQVLENLTDNIAQRYSLESLKSFYNSNMQVLNPGDKYDLVVFLDVATPHKVSPEIMDYAENAKRIIFIDHHPFSSSPWQKEAKSGGVDLDKSIENNLFWVEPKVPANTMLITILIDKLIPNLTEKFRNNIFYKDVSQPERDLIKKMASSLVVGTITDTSGFRRNMNRSHEDMRVPPEKRTGFAPAGLAIWLMSLTNGEVTKRSIKNSMKYDLPNKVDFYFPQDFVDFYNTEKQETDSEVLELPEIEAVLRRNKTKEYTEINQDIQQNTEIYRDIGLGVSKVHFSNMKRILDALNIDDPEINMRDIIGAYKFNPTMIGLKYRSADPMYQVNPLYEDSKISVMVREEEVKGELNSVSHVSDKDTLGFSFRSPAGTNYAGLLGVLFGGGGHPSASGASLSLPGITADSKLKILINGEEEQDFNKIYQTMKYNYNCIYYDNEQNISDIEFTISEDGYTIPDIMAGVTTCIRNNKAVQLAS